MLGRISRISRIPALPLLSVSLFAVDVLVISASSPTAAAGARAPDRPLRGAGQVLGPAAPRLRAEVRPGLRRPGRPSDHRRSSRGRADSSAWSSGRRSCAVTLAIAPSITSWRRRRIISSLPMCSRSSAVGSISTTVAPVRSTSSASARRRRPAAWRSGRTIRSPSVRDGGSCDELVGLTQTTRSRRSPASTSRLDPSTGRRPRSAAPRSPRTGRSRGWRTRRRPHRRGRRPGARRRRAARSRSPWPPPPSRGAGPTRWGSCGGSSRATAPSTPCLLAASRRRPLWADSGRAGRACRAQVSTSPGRGRAPAVKPVAGGGPVPVGGHGVAVCVGEPIRCVAGGVGHHQPGRGAAGEQGAGHRAGGGPDDPVGASGIPPRLGRDRVQGADQPCAPQHASRSENEADPSHGRSLADLRVVHCGHPPRLIASGRSRLPH